MELDDMTLTNSTAFASQLYTAYHFNTLAGEETFYDIFSARLNALLNPDFTDEDIRREICHVGVVVDPTDGTLSLDEKGPVYNEMVSNFEKLSYHFETTMKEMIYGEDHPVANVQGGEPSAMRTMIPSDLWDLHRKYYVPANIGVILSIPDNIELDPFMGKISEILDMCVKSDTDKQKDNTRINSITVPDLPDPQPQAEPGTIVITGYLNDINHAPCQIQYLAVRSGAGQSG